MENGNMGGRKRTTHFISLSKLSEIVIADIKQKAAMVESDEQGLAERVGNRKATESQALLAALYAAKRAAEKRHAELERLVQSLYVDTRLREK